MTNCKLIAVPDPSFSTGAKEVPSVAWCMTHEMYPGADGCAGVVSDKPDPCTNECAHNHSVGRFCQWCGKQFNK